jgi:Tfp pilus assembly protein PilF
VNLALILAGRGDFTAARQELERGLEKDSGNVKALTALGMIEGKTNDPAAVDTFRKVVTLDPTSAEAHLNLGIALADRHQTDAALAEFNEAVRLAPQSAAPYYNKGRLLGELRRFDEAIPELREACRLEPGFADSYYRLGLAERESGNNERAADALRKAVELDPHNGEAAYLLGQALAASGRTSEATAAWSKALSINPNDTQALYSLMRAYQKSDPKLAAQYQARLRSLQEQKGLVERSETLSNSGITAARQGDWPNAIRQMREAIEVCAGCSSLPKLRKNLGLTECQAGQFAGCERDLREALADLPGDPEIRQALDLLAKMNRK